MTLHPACKVTLPARLTLIPSLHSVRNLDSVLIVSHLHRCLQASTGFLFFVTAAHHRRSFFLEMTLIGPIVLPRTNKVEALWPDGSVRISPPGNPAAFRGFLSVHEAFKGGEAQTTGCADPLRL